MSTLALSTLNALRGFPPTFMLGAVTKEATIDQFPGLDGHAVALQGWLCGKRHGGGIVFLILRDGTGEVVWREVCIGDIEDDRAVPAPARPDKDLAERYLPQAVKRCNACLLGQLRQYLHAQTAGR